MSYALLRRLHQWLGLILGLQLILWTISGLVMMDYSGRDNFNNGWVIAAAASIFWLALSGVLMLARDLSRGQYQFWHRKAALRGPK